MKKLLATRPHTLLCNRNTQAHTFLFCTQTRCSAVILCSELNFHRWFVRPCYSFSHYGTFTQTASPAEAYRPRPHARWWTVFVGQLVGAECRRLHAVYGSCTYYRFTCTAQYSASQCTHSNERTYTHCLVTAHTAA